MLGLNSLEDNPYRPPTILGPSPYSINAVHTSVYRGSPIAPGSLVLSRTVSVSTLAGMALKKLSESNGR